ncbi:MAG: hypothetical protein ACRCYW_13700 [Aeromonas sp.]|uniref:hypothetical protein n=1 Tax=Aeromonas sp. TaxID=647 RepID=UPI003F306B90
MRNSVSHLLSRLLNSGAAFDAPHAHGDVDKPGTSSQDAQSGAQRQNKAPSEKTLSDERDRQTVKE